MNLIEMNKEQLLVEYLRLASQAFQAKTASLKNFHQYTLSNSANSDYYEWGKRLECEYEKHSKTLNLINTLLQSKGVDAEILEEIKF